MSDDIPTAAEMWRRTQQPLGDSRPAPEPPALECWECGSTKVEPYPRAGHTHWCPECKNHFNVREATPPAAQEPPVNAHTLTLEFGRFLSEPEWREIMGRARGLPYVQGLRADAVSVPAVSAEQKAYTRGFRDGRDGLAFAPAPAREATPQERPDGKGK